MFVRYYEAGFNVIPTRPNSKAPLIAGFDKYSTQRIDRSLIDDWETRYTLEKGFGVAIVCGPISNVVVLDIDSDDPALLNSCPISPVQRRGKKGEARFFKYSPDLVNRNLLRKDLTGKKIDGIDLLVERKILLLPPSIHPDTKKPYFWLTPDSLETIKADDLPVLTPLEFTEVEVAFGGGGLDVAKLTGQFHSPDGKRAPHGSQGRLRTFACGLIADNMALGEAVNRLLSYDQDHHKEVPYFSDPRSISDGGADPYSNAARFYCNVLKSVNTERLKKNQPPQIPDETKAIEIDVSDLKPKNNQHKFIPYPRPRGLMGDFLDHCEILGKGRQDALGVGGALTLMAGLSSNRYRSRVSKGYIVTPNLYILNLGYSSFGKGVAQRLLDDLLIDTGLIGSANYKSGSSIVQDLPKQQERVDLIDECSWLLKSLTKGESYQAEMVEILSLLFDRAATRFHGIASVGHGARHGAVWNPHVTLLGSTTPTGFKESVNSAMASKGLMPRFLTFFQKEIGKYKRSTDRVKVEELFTRMRQGVKHHTSIEKCINPKFKPPKNLVAKYQDSKNRDISQGIRYAPTMIPFTPEADTLYEAYDERMHYKSAANPEAFDSAFFGRFAELAAKCALLDAISLGRSHIEADSIDWAILLVEIQWKNVQPLYQLATAGSFLERDMLKVLEVIKDNDPIKKNDLTRKVQWCNRKHREELVAQLIEVGKIEELMIKDKNSRKAGTYYQVKRGVNA